MLFLKNCFNLYSSEMNFIDNNPYTETFLIFIYLFIFVFLGVYPQHMEVPRLGVKSELQLPVYTGAQQRRIRAASATYTTARGNAGSLTH